MAHPFFDSLTYPWSRSEAVAFHRALVAAYREPQRIDLLYRQCKDGLPTLALNAAPDIIWKEALDNLAVRGGLRQLCDLVQADEGLGRSEQFQAAVRDVVDAQQSNPVNDLAKILPLLASSDPTKGLGELVYTYLAERYSWGYARLAVTAWIEPDGSAVYERELSIDAYAEVKAIEQTFTLAQANKNMPVAYPTSVLRPLPGSSRKIELSPPEQLGNRLLLYQVRFDPALDRSSGDQAAFVLRQDLPAGLYAMGWNQERLDAEHITEQVFGWIIHRPTRRFTMTVYLPLEYDPGAVGCSVPPKPTLAPIGEAHRHKAEEKRLMGKVARQEMGNRVSYSLTVDYPLIGVTYLLHWKPVAAR